jgi:hypothetical protein
VIESAVVAIAINRIFMTNSSAKGPVVWWTRVTKWRIRVSACEHFILERCRWTKWNHFFSGRSVWIANGRPSDAKAILSRRSAAGRCRGDHRLPIMTDLSKALLRSTFTIQASEKRIPKLLRLPFNLGRYVAP